IVHGDIKPANVLVKDNLDAVICDFGLSRVILGAGQQTMLTTTNIQNGGTTGYRPKEVLDGKTSPTEASDVFAFGGLILFVMSGDQPFFKKKTDSAVVTAIIKGKEPIPADHPGLPENDSLWTLMRRCWKPDPELRPTMKIVIEE
ncbi:hypothetical protein FRB90_009742, partial [Tulasnella sp. 427]